MKLGSLCPELQRIGDELAADAPAYMRGLSASQLAAELEARDIEPTTDLAQEKRRKYCRRRQVKHWEQRRRNRKLTTNRRRTLPILADFSLLELHPVFLGNFVQLLKSELLWQSSRSARYLTKKRLESWWRHDPKQQ